MTEDRLVRDQITAIGVPITSPVAGDTVSPSWCASVDDSLWIVGLFYRSSTGCVDDGRKLGQKRR